MNNFDIRIRDTNIEALGSAPAEGKPARQFDATNA